MSCARWEERVALFAGGDLGVGEVAGVERHLSQCAACSALAADLRLELDGLREVHAEPLAAAHYAVVRGRVLAELAKPQSRSAAWALAWAAALAIAAAGACVVWLAVRPSTLPAPEMPRIAAVAPKVERLVPRGHGGNHSRTAAAQRLMAGRRTRRLTGQAVVPGTDVVPVAVAAVAPRTSPAATAAEDAPVRMVQLATDDPNVVIYWLFEEKGEER